MKKGTRERRADLRLVPVAKIRVSPALVAQRHFRPNHPAVKNEFDLDLFKPLDVSFRDDWYWAMDGQHRLAAYKQWEPDWKNQQIDCWVWAGLSESEEAELFLSFDEGTVAIRAFDKFKIAITAGRGREMNVEALARKNGYVIKEGSGDQTLSCVTTALRVFDQTGEAMFDRTLKITSEAYPDQQLEGRVLAGLGHVVTRYNGALPDQVVAKALGNQRGGQVQLLSRAAVLRKQTGSGMVHCVAAAIVDAVNKELPARKKLPSWWRVSVKVDEA